MPYQQRRKPADVPQAYDSEPIKLRPMQPKVGRPKALPAAPVMEFTMSDDERYIYDYFIQAAVEEYKLTPFDKLLLPLCACEYLKYCRLLQKEMASGELVLMSRQHPGTQFSRFMAQLLGTTRAARLKAKPETDDDSFDWSKAFAS